jgi:predicted RNA-binding Zn ribbon-like protein
LNDGNNVTESKRTLETLELVGGALCFDFANTINSRRSPEHDYLLTYSDVVDWAGKVEILSSQQARSLKHRGTQDVKNAEKALKKGQRAREIIYQVFSAIANQARTQDEDLSAITRLYQEAIANAHFVRAEEHYEIQWKTDETFDALLWPIISSAEKILVSAELSQVKECPGCGWLFLDTSKNQSRRWCSMNTCGARDKMRRYHTRLKKN